jgi:hypothetical protein
MALGYFERVDLSTEPVEGHPDQLVVNVEVAERPTGTFQIGAGFSSVENFIATAQIQQLNLFGRGQSLTLQAQLSGLRQIFSLRFVEPYFFDSNWTFAVDLYNTVRAYTDFSRTSTGGTLTFGYPILGQRPAPLRQLHRRAGRREHQHLHGLFGQTTLPVGLPQPAAGQHLPERASPARWASRWPTTTATTVSPHRRRLRPPRRRRGRPGPRQPERLHPRVGLVPLLPPALLRT